MKSVTVFKPAVMRTLFAAPFAFSLFTSLSVMAEDVQKTGDTVGGVRAPAAAPSNAVSRKRYPGGADEDDLQVQATLPLPSRTLDGSAVTMASGESEEGQAPPPAND